jgi:hypothetical protein
MRSRLEPMKKMARMLRSHEALLMNWFRAKGELSSAAVEGLNNKIRVITRRSYGFRTFKAMEMALYHTLGRLPEPESTHRFCVRTGKGKVLLREEFENLRRRLAGVFHDRGIRLLDFAGERTGPVKDQCDQAFIGLILADQAKALQLDSNSVIGNLHLILLEVGYRLVLLVVDQQIESNFIDIRDKVHCLTGGLRRRLAASPGNCNQ